MTLQSTATDMGALDPHKLAIAANLAAGGRLFGDDAASTLLPKERGYGNAVTKAATDVIKGSDNGRTSGEYVAEAANKYHENFKGNDATPEAGNAWDGLQTAEMNGGKKSSKTFDPQKAVELAQQVIYQDAREAGFESDVQAAAFGVDPNEIGQFKNPFAATTNETILAARQDIEQQRAGQGISA